MSDSSLEGTIFMISFMIRRACISIWGNKEERDGLKIDSLSCWISIWKKLRGFYLVWTAEWLYSATHIRIGSIWAENISVKGKIINELINLKIGWKRIKGT
jgi:hypothetical protein